MKKLTGLLAVVFFLAIPFAANATLVGTGDLDVVHSGPTGGGYYLDYDGTLNSSTFGYTFTDEEVFCVSKDDDNGGMYDFYTITSDIDSLFSTTDLYASLIQAAWIADNWNVLYSATDANKGSAQKAVWDVTDVMHIVGTDAIAADLVNKAAINTANGYSTNWFYAYSPSVTDPDAQDFQEFITPGHPVPEPATMLMLGSALFVLAGFGSRKFRKR